MARVPSDTRVDRIIKWGENNPILAPIIAAAIALVAIGAGWNQLPLSWRSAATGAFHMGRVDGGWIFLGYLDHNTPVSWSEGPYADKIGAMSPLNPFPKGSRIRLNHKRELIILDFKKAGTKLVYLAPPSLHGILRPEDHTGSILDPGAELTIRDEWTGHFPDEDYAVWVRVVPATAAD